MSSMLPPNATDQERALEGTVERLSAVQVPMRSLWNPDTCPAAMLPWLAWAFSLDEWDLTWNDAQRRNAIKSSYSVHRHKGTIGAVKSALNALGLGVRVQEWFNQLPAGDPYTFRLLLEANQVGIDQVAFESVFAVVQNTKNLRSHLDEVELSVTSTTGPVLAVVTGIGSEITVEFGGTLELGYVNSGYVAAGYVV